MFASAEAGSSRFPMDTAAYLSPMEKMMLAKAALMEEEERERAAKRERRWSRRQTTLELNTPGGSARSSIISLQSNNSLDSISPRGKLPSASILRKPSTSSVSSADSYPAAPSRSGRSASSSLVVGRYTDYGPSFRSLSTDGSTSPSRRRSSKVRFDDEPVSPAPTSLNLAWGTPTSNYSALSSPESRGDNGLYSPSPLHLAKSEHRLSTSSITGLRDDILRTSKALGSALISRSGPSSVSGDDRGLELMPMSRLSIPEIRMEGGEEREDFKSLPLPYPKMSKRLSQLSIAESLSEDNRRLSFEGSICNPSDDERLQPSRVPSISDRSDCSFYAAAPMSSLRAALRNPSLGSMASCDGNSALSYAPSVRASIGSIASTIFSSVSADGADSLASRSDFGDAEEFNTAKPAFTATFEAQDSAYSSLLPSAAPTPKQSSVTAFSTLSDDEGSIAETPIQSMNRAPWGEDMGLSPRSGPSPIIDENPPMVPPQLAPPSPELLAEEMPVFEEQAEVALPASPSLSVPPLTNDSAVSSSSLKGLGVYNTPDHLITPFKLINPFEHMALEPKVLKPLLASAMLRDAHSDSIDMLPGDLHLRSQSAASSVNGQGASAHRRTDSAVSVGDMLSFPVPPSRQHTPPPTVMPATRRVGVTSFSALQRTPPTQVVDEIHNSSTLTEDEETTPTPGSKNAGTVPVNEISLDTPVADQITTMNSPLTPPPFAERRYTGRSSPRLDETIKRSPSKKANSIDDDSELEIDADSDLDISQPLVRAAIQSKILSPNTSLNKEPSPKRRPALLRSGSTSPTDLRPGMSFTKNLGWSGSESEEEGFVSAIRDITLKKLSGESSTSPRRRYKVKLARSTSANNSPPSRSGSSDLSSPLTVRKSKSASRINVGSPTPTHPVLESRKSTASRASSSDSNGPITPHAVDDVTEAVMVVVEVSSHQSRPSTPSASSPGGSGSKATTGMGISMPGKFPWGGSAPSSPTGSIRSVRSNPINGANANGLSGTGRDIESFFDAIKVNQKRSSSSGRKIPTLARKIDLAAGSFLRSNPLVRSASGNSGLPRSNRFNPDRPTPSLRSLKLRGSTMPPPKMLVKGWGAPEVLVGEEWPMVMDSSDSEDDLPVMRGHSKGKKAISALAPWEAQGLKERKERSTPPTQADEWGSLLEEGMPEIGTAH